MGELFGVFNPEFSGMFRLMRRITIGTIKNEWLTTADGYVIKSIYDLINQITGSDSNRKLLMFWWSDGLDQISLDGFFFSQIQAYRNCDVKPEVKIKNFNLHPAVVDNARKIKMKKQKID